MADNCINKISLLFYVEENEETGFGKYVIKAEAVELKMQKIKHRLQWKTRNNINNENETA